MKSFYDALRESIITQALITVLVVGLWVYLVATGQEVPDSVYALVTTVLGFYFGSKVGYRQGEASAMRYVPKRVTDEVTAELQSAHDKAEEITKRGK